MIYSASSYTAIQDYGDSAHFMKRQLIAIIIGLVAMVIVSNINYHFFERFYKIGYIIAAASIPVVLTPFFAVALLRFRKLARENFRAIRGCNSKMSLTVQENIEAVRLVRSFTNEELEKKKFDQSNVTLRDSHIRQVKLSSAFEAVFSLIRQVAYIGSIAVAAVLVMHGQLLVGYLVACADYVFRIMNHVTQINNSIFQMQQQLVLGKDTVVRLQ